MFMTEKFRNPYSHVITLMYLFENEMRLDEDSISPKFDKIIVIGF